MILSGSESNRIRQMVRRAPILGLIYVLSNMTTLVPLNETHAPEAALALSREAVLKFKSLCFWFRSPDAAIETVGDVLLVIRRLRQHGNRETWNVAQKIKECL